MYLKNLRTLKKSQLAHTVLAVAVITMVTVTGIRLLNQSHAATNSIVSVAASQIGVREIPLGSNTGGNIVNYTSGHPETWCADFVSWVYLHAGRPLAGGIGGWRIPSVQSMQAWFQARGLWASRTSSYVPQPGDFVHFNWSGCDCSTNNHAGIVERVSGTTLYTIEGNTSDMVARRSYANYKSYGAILGFGRMNAGTATPAPHAVTGSSGNPYPCPTYPTLREGSRGTCVKTVQWALNHVTFGSGSYNVPVDGVFGAQTKSALMRFQARTGALYNGKANGIVDSLTWSKLRLHAKVGHAPEAPSGHNNLNRMGSVL